MNLQKKEDREKLRQACIEEIAAVRNGTWPRDINDYMRYVSSSPEQALKVSEAHLQYLEELDVRLANNDPELDGWER